MSEEALPVGQREVDHNTTFTDEEINLIESNGLTIAEVRHHLEQVGGKSLETAIGSLVGMKAQAAKEAGAEAPAPEPVVVPEPEAAPEEAPAEVPADDSKLSGSEETAV